MSDQKKKKKKKEKRSGDFNAKIGGNNSRYQHLMGKHGLGKMNENREPLADLRI